MRYKIFWWNPMFQKWIYYAWFKTEEKAENARNALASNGITAYMQIVSGKS